MDPELPRDPRAVAKLLRELAPLPPGTPADLGPWDFLDRVSAGDKEHLVRPALLELLGDGDVTVRRRAAEALTNLPASAPTLDRLLAAARAERNPGPANDALQHALSVYAFGSGRGREVSDALIALAGNRLPVASTMSVIGRYDKGRSLQLARQHAAGDHPARGWSSLAMSFAMYHRDALLDLLRALADLPSASKPEVLTDVVRTLTASDAHFAAWATQDGLPVPAKPKPGESDCRAALGA